MTENHEKSRTSRTRFSLGSLFLAVTTIGSCLAAVQFKFRLLDANWFFNYARSVVDPIPVRAANLLFSLQIVTLGIASLLLYFRRKPSLLWVYAASHTLWLAVVVFGFGLQDLLSQSYWISEAFLSVLFFEPTCAIVFAGFATIQSMYHKNIASVLTLALLSLLSLAAVLCASLELHAFGAAISAGIAN